MTEESKKKHEHNHHGCCEKHDNEGKHHKDKEETITISKKEYDEFLKTKENQQKLLYAYAELENSKKRKDKEAQDQICYANERIIKEVLPVIDNLCRAKEHADDTKNKEEQFKNFMDGVDLILKQLKDTLQKFGVKELSSVGEKFNPEFHEAMEQVETDEHDNGTVVNEHQKGYTLNGRVIRPSKVAVAMNKKKED